MKKTQLSVISITLLALSTSAFADSQTISAGYARGNIQNFKQIDGFNLKYRYEWNDPLSLITSFTYLSGNSNSQRIVVKDIFFINSNAKYYGLSTGPAYRINELVSIYGLLGFSNSKVNSSADWMNWGGNGYTYINTQRSSSNNLSLLYSVGVQVNPMPNLALDLAYEGSKVRFDGSDYSVNGFNIGVGYHF